MTKGQVVAHAIDDEIPPGWIVDHLGMYKGITRTNICLLIAIAHFPPSTWTFNEPRSGLLGSLSTRRISLERICTVSGISTNVGIMPRCRYWMETTPATP